MTKAKTSYRVTAATGYAGHQLGDEFTADLDEAAERRALERGSIEVVDKKPAKAKTDDQEDDNDG